MGWNKEKTYIDIRVQMWHRPSYFGIGDEISHADLVVCHNGELLAIERPLSGCLIS